MINGLLKLRGCVAHKVTSDPVLKFFVVGITFYGMSTFEGPLLSVKSVNALSHYTDWTIAHVHSGALGWNGFMTFGMIYWLLPRLFQTKLWSQKMAEWHFWIGTIGILLYIIRFTLRESPRGSCGEQWMMWAIAVSRFRRNGSIYVPFWWARVLGGVLYVGGVLMLGA